MITCVIAYGLNLVIYLVVGSKYNYGLVITSINVHDFHMIIHVESLATLMHMLNHMGSHVMCRLLDISCLFFLVNI
jgi:hypothetical protein